jgi:hypothetical protein
MNITSKLTIGLVSVLTLAGLSLAPAAQARTATAQPDVITMANGVVGIPQVITIWAPKFHDQVVGITLASGGGPVETVTAQLNVAGVGSAQWTPPTAGAWTARGQGAFASAVPTTVTVAPASTTMTLAAALTQAFVPNEVVATVRATTGTVAPTGSVRLTDINGAANFGNAALVPNADGSSSVTFPWTPQGIGITTLVATYAPTAGPTGAANFSASSARINVETVLQLPLVIMRLPSTFTLGQPAQLTMGVTDRSLTGSVDFLSNVNGTIRNITNSIPLQGNNATVSWTPTIPGPQVVSVEFSASNSNSSGRYDAVIDVVAPPLPDPMAISTPGIAPWVVVTGDGSTSAKYRPFQAIPLQIATGSGSAVSLSVDGACMINGNTLLTAPPDEPSVCTVTATTPGGGNFGPNTAVFPLLIQN